METILITGSSGFIGFHLTKSLLEKGINVLGFDNENNYYDVSLKMDRREILEKYQNFKFFHGDLLNLDSIEFIFRNYKIDKIVDLAAYAGIRHSFIDPLAYVKTNIIGFSNLIFLANKYKIKSFIYASSSSVYGNNEKRLLSVEDGIDKPISLYAATKRSNELMAYSYSHSFGIHTIGLRMFTVYGPRSRPDMMMLNFAHKIRKGEPIDVYNYGHNKRDYTYIDDVVDGILKVIDYDAQYDIFNLGSNNPVVLEDIISLLEKYLGKKAIKNYLPAQPGDMIDTNADIQHTKDILGWKPNTSIEKGIKNFVDRFNYYYGE